MVERRHRPGGAGVDVSTPVALRCESCNGTEFEERGDVRRYTTVDGFVWQDGEFKVETVRYTLNNQGMELPVRPTTPLIGEWEKKEPD